MEYLTKVLLWLAWVLAIVCLRLIDTLLQVKRQYWQDWSDTKSGLISSFGNKSPP